jgi:GNAT superfamily N-acetyltransferase
MEGSLMLEIKRLAECSIEEGVKAWNVGFEGYYFDATTNAESFVNRLVSEGLSPRLSIVAFYDNQPIGIVKNGVRIFNGEKIAWNGGTGVAPSFRGKGIGKELMEATLSIYKEEGIDIATLEAISENQNAITLYEKIGYNVVDQLEYLELKSKLSISLTNAGNYIVERAVPQQIGFLSLYKGMNPWQTQWQSAKDSEAIIIKDPNHETEIGYAYFRRSFSPEGKHIGTVLFQCEANPSREDAENIIHFALSQVFGNESDDIRRVIPNLPVNGSNITYKILKEYGFQPIAHQVFMQKEM